MRSYYDKICIFLAAAMSLASCLKDSDSSTAVTTYSETAITSFALTAANRYTHTTNTAGNDTVMKKALTVASHPFTIDQYGKQIYNTNPLPSDCDTKHVLLSIGTKNYGQVALRFLSTAGEDSLAAYSSTDSIDIARLKEIVVVANDNSTHATYQLKVNVADSSDDGQLVSWARAGLADLPATFGQEVRVEPLEGRSFRLSADGGSTWSDELVGEGEDIGRLPTAGLACVSFPVPAMTGVDYWLLTGDGDGAYYTFWRKVGEQGTESKWVEMPPGDSTDDRLPRKPALSLLYVGSAIVAVGSDGSLYESQDQGMTWHTPEDFALPAELAGAGLTAAADADGHIWLMSLDTQEVWRGTLK